ncbi:MAG TPA: SgcJ/EcaC family oxidoreductase [Ornithinibacter sp.]|nr:SgcJ/EcaC family oxidoreductase [Ornithinibacter sp.]
MNAHQVANEVLARLEQAWNDGDGASFGAVYTDDATFVTIRGEWATGRTAITEGHTQIFRTVYAGSTNRMQLVAVRELGDGSLVVSSVSTLTSPTGPLAGTARARSTSVIVPDAVDPSGWRVASTHNTLVAA